MTDRADTKQKATLPIPPTPPTLHEARMERALGVRELARMAGVSESTISVIERGKNRPRLATIRKLATALGVGWRDIAWPGEPFA